MMVNRHFPSFTAGFIKQLRVLNFFVDGSPTWSVDDDAMPLAFFDPRTGEFADSAQARVRSKLMVNFGNPYKEKRANSLVPEKYLSQSPSMVKSGDFGSTTLDRPTSPPHDSFDSVEEGEAIFVLSSPSRKSPKREESDVPSTPTTLPMKRPRSDSDDRTIESLESTSVSESSVSKKSISSLPSTPPPPPPRPPASKHPTANAKQPPPPPPAPPARSKHGIPPPPPPPPTSGVPSTLPTKKIPPPLPPTKAQQRPPPKPPKLESKVSAELNASTFALSEELPIDVPGRPAPPVSMPSAKSLPMATEVPIDTESSKSKEIAETISNFDEKSNEVNDNAKLTTLMANNPAITELHKQDEETQSVALSPDQPVLILDNEHVKPNVELLPGWICVWSKSKQRWYFFDTKTNNSLWNWPP